MVDRKSHRQQPLTVILDLDLRDKRLLLYDQITNTANLLHYSLYVIGLAPEEIEVIAI